MNCAFLRGGRPELRTPWALGPGPGSSQGLSWGNYEKRAQIFTYKRVTVYRREKLKTLNVQQQ